MFHHSKHSARKTSQFTASVQKTKKKKIFPRFVCFSAFQVQVLRNAGEEVTLTVSFLKKTPAFLKLPLCEDCTCENPLIHPGIRSKYIITITAVENNWPRVFIAGGVFFSCLELVALETINLSRLERNKEKYAQLLLHLFWTSCLVKH